MKKQLNKTTLVTIATIFLLSACASNNTATKTQSEQPQQNLEINEWLQVPSLKDTYSNTFKYFGAAVNSRELQMSDSIDGIMYHFSSITMENEFKPQFMFNWQQPNNAGTFTSSKGITIKVPTNVPDFTKMDTVLKFAKSYGINVRGHVLVWHNQTEESFFREDYNPKGQLVDKETMDARQEWYIKSILEHVRNWEDENNDGKRIIYCWDVVNEAVADGGSASSYLRSTGTNWYAIYKSDEFIVNAFRYANKYAPAEVQLAYNDYSCTNPSKTAGILKVIDAIQSTENDAELPGRIDVMGMQSHVDMMNPSPAAFETAIKKFLDKNIDVQITELDVGGSFKSDDQLLKRRYNDLFKTFIKYQKKDGAYGISGVTFWGLDDDRSWISKNGTQFPLLFTRDFDRGYLTKPAYYGVISAAEE